MKLHRLLGAVLVLGLGAHAHAQEDGREVLRRSAEALKNVPAYRVTITDANTADERGIGVRMEVVNPDLFHIVAEEDGGTTEVFSDGKRTLSRDGSSGKFAQAPASVGALVAMARQASSLGLLLQMADNVRFVGRETVNGQPASVYAFDALVMGMRASGKIWVADNGQKPLKAEGEVNGEVRFGHRAGRRVHKHSVAVYEYDPSIKVTMPAN